LRRQPEVLAAFDHPVDVSMSNPFASEGCNDDTKLVRQAAVAYGESELGALRQALLQVDTLEKR